MVAEGVPEAQQNLSLIEKLRRRRVEGRVRRYGWREILRAYHRYGMRQVREFLYVQPFPVVLAHHLCWASLAKTLWDTSMPPPPGFIPSTDLREVRAAMLELEAVVEQSVDADGNHLPWELLLPMCDHRYLKHLADTGFDVTTELALMEKYSRR